MEADYETSLPQEDVAYYQQRAEQELELAQGAAHPDAARAHSLIAGYYLDLVHSSSFAPAKPPPLFGRKSG